jgi:hypothetical protein
VLNGRDIGTVVFPKADVKFFLTASPQERAERRFNEDRAQDPNVSLDETFADMSERDRRDSTRTDSPLKIAEDAVIVDSTGLSVDEVFEKMRAAIEAKGAGMPPSGRWKMRNAKWYVEVRRPFLECGGLAPLLVESHSTLKSCDKSQHCKDELS